MITNNLIKQLKADAIAKGLCAPWQAKFTSNLSLRELIDMYIKGIDFCIIKDYPTLRFLRKEFKGKSEAYGVYIDADNLNLVNIKHVVLNGSCRGLLSYGAYSVSRLFARHDSSLNLLAKDNAIVIINVFDSAAINIRAYDDSQVTVYLYDKAQAQILKQEDKARIKIIHKSKNTY